MTTLTRIKESIQSDEKHFREISGTHPNKIIIVPLQFSDFASNLNSQNATFDRWRTSSPSGHNWQYITTNEINDDESLLAFLLKYQVGPHKIFKA